MVIALIALAVIVAALLLDRTHLKTQIAKLEAEALQAVAVVKADAAKVEAAVVADVKKAEAEL